MKLNKFGILLATVGLLASCSNENAETPQIPSDGDVQASMTLNLKIEGTRTVTGDQGTSNGTEEEYTVNKALLILADQSDNEKIAVEGTKQDDGKWKFNFAGTDFLTLQTLSNPNVYVVTNISKDDYKKFTTPANAVSPIQRVVTLASDADTYWTDYYFLMSNHKAASATIDVAEVKKGTYATTPLHIGTVTVQRTMARLDLEKAQPKNNLADENSNIKIVFQGVSPVNVSQNFYLYKEVGTVEDGFELFADEFYVADNNCNFVNDPKYASGTYSFDLFERVTANQLPNSLTYTNWFGSNDISNTLTYTKLRYVAPNTVTATDEQVNGRSTGLVFKAEITAKSGSLPVSANDGHDLYTYKGVVLGDLTKLQEIVKEPTDLATTVMASQYTYLVGDKTSEADIKAALKADEDFKIYPADSQGKFYCYYYYWIRHNGVGTNSDEVMHPMEFGVVRNNIYKVAVTAVNGLGEPGDFNPDPLNPDDPGKEKPQDNANLTVSIIVEPWDVRIDNIEF